MVYVYCICTPKKVTHGHKSFSFYEQTPHKGLIDASCDWLQSTRKIELKIFFRKFTKSRARAPRGAPCASFLPLNSTVGGPWGPNEGRGGLACGTHVAHQYGRGTLLRACVGPVRPVGGLYRDVL